MFCVCIACMTLDIYIMKESGLYNFHTTGQICETATYCLIAISFEATFQEFVRYGAAKNCDTEPALCST